MIGHFAHGALMVNGDMVHPASVEKTLLAARGTAGVILAIDNVKPLAEEETPERLPICSARPRQ